MDLKIDLIPIANHIKEKSCKLLSIIMSAWFPFAMILLIFFSAFEVKIVEAKTIIQDEKLIEKISKDYTKKFCNSIAFGLSRESAMIFSNKENNLIYKKKKGFDLLDKDLIADKIAIYVVEDCGYIINLRGNEGIDEFKREYLSINNSILKEN